MKSPNTRLLALVFFALIMTTVIYVGFLLANKRDMADAPSIARPKATPTRGTPAPIQRTEQSSFYEPILESADASTNKFKSHHERLAAIAKLGDDRILEAAPDLIANITKVPAFSTGSPGDYLATFPCAAALVKLGEPVVPLIEFTITSTPSRLDQGVLLDVLRSIKGEPYTVSWIKMQVAKDRAAQQIANRDELEQWAIARSQ